MPNWNQLLNEAHSVHDSMRRRYLAEIHNITKRNVIMYYSAWLQNPGLRGGEINDEDKNGFMSVIHKLDRNLGLDLILHTPGGDAAATESLVDYLRAMFGTNIRAIVPQLAMSAGTMIACACKKIVMGSHSSLGPIDPQLGGFPAHGVVEEFKTAIEDVKKDSHKIAIWQPIIAKYRPTFIGECQKAIAWSEEMTTQWLESGMFKFNKNPKLTIENIIKELGDHAVTKSHNRHLSIQRCKKMGLKIEPLEKNQSLQDAVLSLHHASMLTFSETPAFKIIENHNGIAFIKLAQQVLISGNQISTSESPTPAQQENETQVFQ